MKLKALLILVTFLALTISNLALARVSYNTKTQVVHQPSCSSAKRCTKNCVIIPREEAYKKGGKACKICGG